MLSDANNSTTGRIASGAASSPSITATVFSMSPPTPPDKRATLPHPGLVRHREIRRIDCAGGTEMLRCGKRINTQTRKHKGSRPMTPEMIGIVAIGVALLAFMWNLHRDMAGIHRDIAGIHRDITGTHREIADLRERMARIEGLFEGFVGRAPEGGSQGTP